MNNKRSSPDLYDLIQTLNSTEKRHFRLYATRGEKSEVNSYLKLFDILENQAEFDDARAMQRLGIQSKSRYARIKNYLYTSLLEGLEDYYREASVDARFYHLINRAEILIAKQLYGQASKMLKKAAKLADEKGLAPYHLIVERIELNRLSRDEDFKKMEQHLTEYDKRMESHMQKAADSVHLQMIKCKLTWLIRYGESEAAKHQDWVADLCNHELLSSSKYPDDLEYKLYYDNLNGLLYGFMGMEEEDNRHRRSYLNTYRNNPEYISRWPINYIVALGNVAEGAADEFNYSDLLECTEEMRTFLEVYGIRNKSPLEPIVEVRSAALEIDAWPVFSDMQKEELHDRLQKAWRHRNRVTKIWQFTMAFGIARYRFENGQFNQANEWINKVIQDPDDKLEAPIQFPARLLHLLNQYELENHRVLEHAIPAFREWLRKVKIRSSALNLFLRVFRKQLHQSMKKENATRWNKLLPKLEVELAKPEEIRLMRRLDLRSWVASKGKVLRN